MSSAPHLHGPRTLADLTDWGAQPDALEGASASSGRLVHKGPDGRPEVGLWVCTPGRWRLSLPANEFCWFMDGDATYRGDHGDVVEVGPDTAVMFPGGWTGECEVRRTLRNTYMLDATPVDTGGPAPVMRDPLAITALADWGLIPTMIEGASHTSGKLLHKGPGGASECGLWVCTPGTWHCHVTSDEYCHFLEGRATYVHETGEVIEITPDTLALFPRDWKGICTVHETVKKVYMIH